MTQVPLAVIVCTHNPRPDYFARVLNGLRAQTLPLEAWELIVVDNASAAEKAPRPDLAWHPRARIVQEPKLGLTQARLRGIAETAGELLVFVDDDNVLDADYLAIAQRVADERQYLGAWSGQCRPGFETEPPDWTRRYWGNLVIREFDNDVWSNLPRLAATMPCGAGLCVRRAVARHYFDLHETGRRAMLLDRVGTSLVSGGDNDLAGCACDAGFGVGLIAALQLTHLIPAERLNEAYLVRLAEGIQYSGLVLDYLYGVPVAKTSWLRRAWHWRHLLMLRMRALKIALALERGRARALATIDALRWAQGA